MQKDKPDKKDLSSSSYSLDYLEEYANGDKAFIQEIIRFFIDEIPKVIQDLEIAFNKSDLETIRMLAHKTNPQMAIMGLFTGVSLLEKIENNAKTGKTITVGKINHELLKLSYGLS